MHRQRILTPSRPTRAAAVLGVLTIFAWAALPATNPWANNRVKVQY